MEGSASEANFITLLAARARAIREAKEQHPDWSEGEILEKLICYHSEYVRISQWLVPNTSANLVFYFVFSFQS